MKKIGFESEYFVSKIDGTVPVIPPNLFPKDESGILIEIRGEPGNSYVSVFSFVKEYFRVRDMLHEAGLKIMNHCRMRLPNDLKLELSRQFSKPIYKAQNIYSATRTHVKNKSYQYAGLHIHFSNNEKRDYTSPEGIKSTVVIPHILDMPSIIKKMDVKYKDIITSEYRNIGCYELKNDNFEYRSMPTFWIEEIEDIESLISIAKFAYGLL